jgi:phosphoglycerate dehydrogenase-like enzyme
MMLATCRQLPAALDSQRGNHGWPYLALRAGSSLLQPSTRIVIVGYGAIARRLVELLAPTGVSILAFRRTVKGDENCRTLTIDTLEEHLRGADHVVNILPAAESTRGFFGTSRFQGMKRGATFYNIGRGDTTDQEALRASLEAGLLSGAYLDVTTPEPLPPEHPLWTTPNCYITPHTGGGSLDETERQVAHFVANVRRFESGESLIDRIF